MIFTKHPTKHLTSRITSFTLALVLILSNTPLPTYATTPTNPETSTGEHNDMQQSAGGQDGGSIVGRGGDWGNSGDPLDRDNMNIQRAGLRISLVDVNDPTKVVSVDKDGNPRVIDIILCSKSFYDATCTNYQGRIPQIFTDVKTQKLNIVDSNGSTNYKAPNKVYQYFLPDQIDKLRSQAENGTLDGLNQQLYDNLNMSNLVKAPNVDDPNYKGVPEPIDQLRWATGTNPYRTSGNILAEWLAKNKFGEHVALTGGNPTTTDRNGDKITPPTTTSNDKKGSSSGIKKQDNPKKQQTTQSTLDPGWVIGAMRRDLESTKQHFNDYSYLKTKQDWIEQLASLRKWRKSYKSQLQNWYNQGLLAQSYVTSFGNQADSLFNKFQDKYAHKMNDFASEAQKAKQKEAQDSLNKNKDRYKDKQFPPRVANPRNATQVSFNTKPNKKTGGLLAQLNQLIFNPITVYAAPATTEGEHSSSTNNTEDNLLLPEGSTTSTTENTGDIPSHLSYILQLTDEQGLPLFITEDTRDVENHSVKKIPETGNYMSVLYPIKSGTANYRILVEPVDWFTPFGINGDKVLSKVRFYGTITNIVQAMELFRLNGGPTVNEQLNNGNSPHLNRKTFNLFSWSAMTTGDETTDIGFKDFKFTNPAGIPGIGTQQKSNRWLYDNSLNQGGTQLGWGVQVYWPSSRPDSSGTHTWDYEKYPQAEPAPSPEFPSTTTPAKKLKVAKWYYITNEVTNTETVVGVKNQDISGSPILIENEGDENTDIYWEVEGWATGKEDKMPAQDDLSKNYEDYVKSNPGNYGDTGTANLVMAPEDPDQVLYVKLVQTIIPRRNVDIVKVFQNGDDSKVEVEQNVRFPMEGYDPSDSRGTYIEHVESAEARKDISKWEDTIDIGPAVTESPIHKHSETITVYIYYTSDGSGGGDGDTVFGDKQSIILNEDELSYGYTLKNLRTNGVLVYLQDKFESRSRSRRECDGHWHSTKHGGYYRYGSYRRPEIDDNRYCISVTSGNNNPNFILDYAPANAWETFGYLGIGGGLTNTLNPNASYLLYRNKDKDLVTLYPDDFYNTPEVKSKLQRLGITQVSATPVTNRIATTGHNKFFDKLNINFTKTSNYDDELSWKWYCSRGHGYELRANTDPTWHSKPVPTHSLSDLNKAYTFDNSVATYYELGQTGTGTAQPEAKRADDFANVFYNNPFVSVQKDGDVQFYPYTVMKLYDQTNTNPDAVAVTSTNTSTVSAYTKIESGVWKNGQKDDTSASGTNPQPNVALDSTQWSTHKNGLNFMTANGVTDKKSILPGGATYDVSMRQANQSVWNGFESDPPTTSTKLGYRVWQTCIDDRKAGLLAPGSTAPTKSEAKQKIEELDASIKADIPKYGLVQAVTSGIVDYNGYLANYLNGGYGIVESGGTWNSIPLSTDAKYYLKLVKNGADASTEFNSTVTNFDVLKGGIKQQKIYTVWSTPDGTVGVSLDGQVLATITKEQGVADLIAKSADIKLLDESTKVVTNYIKSIDRNIGSNGAKEKWYNESFDGVDVLYSYLSYDIGFGNSIVPSPGANGQGTEKRSAVLDPKLTGKLDNKADLYNFNKDTQEAKIRSSIILTGSAESLAAPSGNLGQLGLKNGNSIQITLKDMRELAFSKLFYIPNANVTDLN